MRYALVVLIMLASVACSSPSENITAIKADSYQSGYDAGYGKGYIKGTEDSRTSADATTQNAYKDGYLKGYTEGSAAAAKSDNITVPPLVSTMPINTTYSLVAKYVGNKSTKLYHNPLCSQAQQIALPDQVWSDSVKVFIMQGMKPCELCKPPK